MRWNKMHQRVNLPLAGLQLVPLLVVEHPSPYKWSHVRFPLAFVMRALSLTTILTWWVFFLFAIVACIGGVAFNFYNFSVLSIFLLSLTLHAFFSRVQLQLSSQNTFNSSFLPHHSSCSWAYSALNNCANLVSNRSLIFTKEALIILNLLGKGCKNFLH